MHHASCNTLTNRVTSLVEFFDKARSKRQPLTCTMWPVSFLPWLGVNVKFQAPLASPAPNKGRRSHSFHSCIQSRVVVPSFQLGRFFSVSQWRLHWTIPKTRASTTAQGQRYREDGDLHPSMDALTKTQPSSSEASTSSCNDMLSRVVPCLVQRQASISAWHGWYTATRHVLMMHQIGEKCSSIVIIQHRHAWTKKPIKRTDSNTRPSQPTKKLPKQRRNP